MNRKKSIERLRNAFGYIKDDSFNFELVEAYFRHKDNSNAFQVISDKTCNDLDFQDLFTFLDRTSSKVGQQYLYNRLRTIPGEEENRKMDERIIRKLEDEEFRIKIQLLLKKLGKDEAYYISSLFQEAHLKPPKWFFLVRILSFTNLLSLILLPFNAQLLFVILGVFIINLGIHYWNKRNLYQYLGSIPQLLHLNSIARKLYKFKEFEEINPTLPDSIKVIDQVRNRMSFFRLEASLQGDLEAVFWAILELFKTLFLLEPLLLFGVLKRLDTKRKEIEDVFCFVGYIDALISTASVRKGMDCYCIPRIESQKKNMSMMQAYHPLIVDCVPNSIVLSEKSVLLTGSNMSGKTSFIRTVGINLITGLTINTCFAEEVCIPKMRIYSAIRISDDLLNDKSYYFEEVLVIKEMLQVCTEEIASLFLLDEIFKGTNTIERISAGKAVLSMLTENKNFVFVSTHDVELTDLLSDTYELYHFSEIVKDGNIDFDFKLKEGKLLNRNAIRILQMNDYPDAVVKEAIELSGKLKMLTAGTKK